MLNLLRMSLVSKNPLTEVCFHDVCLPASANLSLAIKEEINVNEEESDQATIKLVLNKKTNDVLHVDVGEQFDNQLLSFLTFPLGYGKVMHVRIGSLNWELGWSKPMILVQVAEIIYHC